MNHIFEYSEVLKLKAVCAERFPDHVHFHDGCGGQYFSLDEENGALRDLICEYFSAAGLRAEFSEDGKIFTVSEK